MRLHPHAPRPSFLRKRCRLTLRQALVEYYAAEASPDVDADVPAANIVPPRLREHLAAHDAAHVVFGCDTSIRGELALSRWALLGSTDWLPIYFRGLLVPGGAFLFVEFLRKARPVSFLLGMIDAARALLRSLRMPSRWPASQWRNHLDRPLTEIRGEYGIEVL
jgi:ubiquinone biosynthesis protein Coq4